MARWIWQNRDPAPQLAQTIIAGWWPGRYYSVLTWESLGATGQEPMEKLLRSVGARTRDEYLLVVFKVNRHWISKGDEPLYQFSFQKKQEALDAHREVVRLLASGKRRLLKSGRNPILARGSAAR